MLRPVRSILAISGFVAAAVAGQEPLLRPLAVDDMFRLASVGGLAISGDGSAIAYTVTTLDEEKDTSETALWVALTEGGETQPWSGAGYSASRPRFSPDGLWLSFLSSRPVDLVGGKEDAKVQVWAFRRAGGDARKLTEVEQGVEGYEWSPDSRRLVLVIKDPEPKEFDATTSKGAGSETKPRPRVIDRLQFKRDYQGYLDHRRDHLYRFDLERRELVQLTFGDFDDSEPSWSPDGRLIVFTSNRSSEPDANDNDDLWLVAAIGPSSATDPPPAPPVPLVPPDIAASAGTGSPGEPPAPPPTPARARPLVQLTTQPGRDWSPTWSPSGSAIAYLTVTEPELIWYATQRLAVVTLDPTGSPSAPRIVAPELDRNAISPRFAPDGQSVYFLLEDQGAQVLATLDLEADKPEVRRPVDGERSISAFAVSPAGKVALIDSAPHQPEDVAVYDARGVRLLGGHNRGLIAALRLARVEKVSFTSPDGAAIEGFVTFPIDAVAGDRSPTVLRIHGGPASQYDWGFDFESQLLAANGYLVVRVNPRGSTGYGQDFARAIFADWGNKDFEDVMAGVDFAIEKGWADPERLGVGGWSYGGILTNYVITKTDRFKGAISGASEVLYVANYGHDHYQREWEAELGLPWKTRELWERLSPYNAVEKITTPTLILGGALDWNVPILNSELLYQGLRRLGRTTQLVVYPGEHHGIRRPSFQKDRYQRYLDWYRRHVKGG